MVLIWPRSAASSWPAKGEEGESAGELPLHRIDEHGNEKKQRPWLSIEAIDRRSSWRRRDQRSPSGLTSSATPFDVES